VSVETSGSDDAKNKDAGSQLLAECPGVGATTRSCAAVLVAISYASFQRPPLPAVIVYSSVPGIALPRLLYHLPA
jgi:hypothetical protein